MKIRHYILALFILFLISFSVVMAGGEKPLGGSELWYLQSGSLRPNVSTWIVGNSSINSTFKISTSSTICLSGDTCRTTWPAATMVYPDAGIALSTGAAWDTSITNNSANWNTAYSWGDWSGEGFITLGSLSGTSPITYNNGTGAIGFTNPGYITQAIASTTFVDRALWTTIDNYPTGCTNQFIRTIGDTLTCASVANTDLTNSTMGLTSSGSITIGTSPISLGGTSALNFNMDYANTWTALQTFGNASTTNTSSTYASSTSGYFGSFYLPNLGNPAGKFLAVDATGLVIATTTPTGGSQTPWTSNIDAGGFELDNVGYIGVGIASPSEPIHIDTADNTLIRLSSSGTYDSDAEYFGLTIYNDIYGQVGGLLYSHTTATSSAGWQFYTQKSPATTPVMTLDGYGLLTVGNASTTQLTVSSNSYFGTISTGLWNGTDIDISDYTNLTAGDALTLTDDDIDFDGGASPGGSLGGTWASPTIDDLFLLNNGDIGTGVYDFGGADTFEIPNGASPTITALGQIAFDTTDNQILIATTTANTPIVLPTMQVLFAGGLGSTSPDFISGGRQPTTPVRDGFVVREIWCLADGGTSVVINFSNLAGTTDSETVTCDTDGQSDTDITTKPVYTAGGVNSIEYGTITGTVDYVTWKIYGYWTRE